jgi:hypothetical protein
MNRNTYADSKGNSTRSSGYELIKVELTNVDGLTKDIKGLVGYTKIHEGLFNPTLVLELGIRDEGNFFEEFNLTGNEVIDIEIETKALDLEQTISLRFFVVKYEDFVKGKDGQVQVYTLTAVSEFAYIAPLKTISKYVSGNSTNIIDNIFKNDLNTGIVIKGDCLSTFNGIIPISNPLKAALKIKKLSFDANNTPYMLFQRLNGLVYLQPLSFITDLDENPVYKSIHHKSEIESDSNTPEEFFERSTSMNELTSKINISPSYQAKQGQYASENRYIDIGTKTYRKHIFNAAEHLKAENTISKKLDNKGKEQSTKSSNETSNPFEKLPGARINYQYTNKLAFEGFNSMAELSEKNKHLSDAYLSAYDVCTHRFSLFGDPLLNPGRCLELLFPKATDPATYKENTDKSITEQYDKLLSGNYLLFNTSHVFKDNIYTTECIVKTDSLKEETKI